MLTLLLFQGPMSTKEQECPERNEFTVFNFFNRPMWCQSYTPSVQRLHFSPCRVKLTSSICRLCRRRCLEVQNLLVKICGFNQYLYVNLLIFFSGSKHDFQSKNLKMQLSLKNVLQSELCWCACQFTQHFLSGSLNGSKTMKKKTGWVGSKLHVWTVLAHQGGPEQLWMAFLQNSIGSGGTCVSPSQEAVIVKELLFTHPLLTSSCPHHTKLQSVGSLSRNIISSIPGFKDRLWRSEYISILLTTLVIATWAPCSMWRYIIGGTPHISPVSPY